MTDVLISIACTDGRRVRFQSNPKEAVNVYEIIVQHWSFIIDVIFVLLVLVMKSSEYKEAYW